MNKPFSWRIFLILWAACIVGIILVLPYAFTLQASILAQVSIPFWVLVLASVVQSAILFGVVSAVGLWLANRIGLGLSIVPLWLEHQPVGSRIREFALPAIIVGAIGSIVVLALELFVFQPQLVAQFGESARILGPGTNQPPWWQGLLASFYGGIDEEVLLRLFVMSLLAFLGKFVSHTAEGCPTMTVLWIANILAAVLFGLGHLPATSALMPLTPLVIIRAVTLNGLLGIAFGYFYVRYGLEAAMLSHFSADLVLHVLTAF